MSRIERRFAKLKAEARGALVTFITAGDPDTAVSTEILLGLPAAGADLIELGMPFTDPMADGPAIQESSLRALKAGAGLRTTLEQVRQLRARDQDVPVVLMGYFNPIHRYGVPAFLADAKAAGVDGLIVVDLPPEEDDELCEPAIAAGLNFIRLVTPTTDAKRLPTVLRNAGGFVYYVSITGITGTAAAANASVNDAVARLRAATDLPVAVGFGIRGAAQVKEITSTADAAVVGSAIVNRIKANLDEQGRAKPGLVTAVLDFVRELAGGVRKTA